MNKKYVFILTMIIMLVAGCSTVPTKDIKVYAEADPKVNFSNYKSYAWLGSAAIVNDPHGQWEPPAFDADAEIKYLLDREFSKHGISQSSRNPDLVVVFSAGIDMDSLKLKTDPDTKMGMLKNVPQGGLVVVLIDRETGFAVWTGVATAEVRQNADAKTTKARLYYAVTHMLKKLPK